MQQYCLTLDTGYSTVLYSVWSCAPTQRSWTITDFILHLHLHCRSIKFAVLHLFLFDFL